MVGVSDGIDGGNVLPLDCHGVVKQFHNVVNSVKSRCGDYDTQEESYLGYYCKVIKRVNKKEDEHEIQIKNLHQY